MSYITEYPTNIPSLTDLPDYQDNVDDVKEEVVNDPKTELRACLIELGTLPKGSAADVAARLAVSLNDDGTLKDTLSPTFVNLTLSGALAVNSGNITSTGAIRIKASGDNDDYFHFNTIGGEARLIPSKDSTYKIGLTGAVLAEVWTDKIAADGNLTLHPGGGNVILDNAHLQIQGTYDLIFTGAGTITHQSNTSYFCETFFGDADTGWETDSNGKGIFFKRDGSNIVRLGSWGYTYFYAKVAAEAGVMIGGEINNAWIDDSSNGSGSDILYIGNKMIAVSGGGTGGSGSAGSGNQYVELKIGGATYKVLHDGTV